MPQFNSTTHHNTIQVLVLVGFGLIGQHGCSLGTMWLDFAGRPRLDWEGLGFGEFPGTNYERVGVQMKNYPGSNSEQVQRSKDESGDMDGVCVCVCVCMCVCVCVSVCVCLCVCVCACV